MSFAGAFSFPRYRVRRDGKEGIEAFAMFDPLKPDEVSRLSFLSNSLLILIRVSSSSPPSLLGAPVDLDPGSLAFKIRAMFKERLFLAKLDYKKYRHT